ncbi:hypothetical protein F5Y17DRAFT_431529 [Xylariaceae sp. FL0594]|nr:hypothetical protein F5Y17DRAFT_431529 [Xylariaceae sp. FL0594]
MAILPHARSGTRREKSSSYLPEKIHFHNHYYPSPPAAVTTTTTRARSRSSLWFPRRRRHSIIERLVAVAVVFGVVYLFREHVRYRSDLRAKYSATTFGDEVRWWVGHSDWDITSESASVSISISDPDPIFGEDSGEYETVENRGDDDRGNGQENGGAENNDEGSKRNEKRTRTWAGHEILDHRNEWKRVAAGWEGEIFVYHPPTAASDNSRVSNTTGANKPLAIKTFFTSRSPLRNCIRRTVVTTAEQGTDIPIPTEILATVLLGGLSVDDGGRESGKWGNRRIQEKADFMPAVDFFHLPPAQFPVEEGEAKNARESESSVRGPSTSGWHLVTPFFPAGNLKNLAERLRPLNLTAKELDARFRRSFERLLGALEKMHGRYGLCHDDVKAENIFVVGSAPTSASVFSSSAPASSPSPSPSLSPSPSPSTKVLTDDDDESSTHWLLADFGNTREITHPYHATAIWTRDSRQHGDCRVNDVLRLLKTYIGFLRIASSSSSSSSGKESSFDKAFWTASEPWSELYWSWFATTATTTTPTISSILGEKEEEKIISSTAAGKLRAMSSLSLPPSSPPLFLPLTESHSHDHANTNNNIFRSHDPHFLSPTSAFKARATDEELRKGMWVTEDRARVFALTALFGVPRGGGC